MREIADQHERALVTARDRIGDLEAKLERGGGGGGDDASAASDASTDAKVPELQKKLRVAAATVKKLRARETELEEALKAATGGEGGDDAAKAAEAEAAEARTRLDEKAAEVESLSDALEAERESSRSLKLALEEQTAATKKAATAATTAATKELDAERATSSELRAKTQEMAQIIEQLNDALAESHAAEEDARAAEEVRDAMAEQNESALRADVANLTSEARPRSITLVPIPPRSRGERRSLRTLLPGASISPPRVPRWFQSRHTATPFNSASDAFQLHPDVIARTDPRPSEVLSPSLALARAAETADVAANRAETLAGAMRTVAELVEEGRITDPGEALRKIRDVARRAEKTCREVEADAARGGGLGVTSKKSLEGIHE